jgi:hypothetical protein
MAVYLTGESGSFTFSGAESLLVADFGEWNATIDRKVFPSTPFGYLTDRVTLGRITVSGSFTGFFDGTKPPIPANGATSGTLTLYLKTTSTSVSYVFKARIFALSTGANSVSGEPTRQTYQFVGSADSASDTIA